MTVVLEPSIPDLETERDRLLSDSPFNAADLNDRATTGVLTQAEARLLRRLREIDYLLGDGD